MNTKHPSIYADFYKRDLAYIKQQRANEPKLIDILDSTDAKFTREFGESISFADLNFIAENWSKMLTQREETFDWLIGEYKHSLILCKDYGY